MNRLSALREDKDMSQADLARVWGVSASAISQWENGTREMDYNTLILASNFFKKSINYILCNEDFAETYTKEEKQLVSQYRSLSKKLKKLLVNLSNEIYKMDSDGDY